MALACSAIGAIALALTAARGIPVNHPKDMRVKGTEFLNQGAVRRKDSHLLHVHEEEDEAEEEEGEEEEEEGAKKGKKKRTKETMKREKKNMKKTKRKRIKDQQKRKEEGT